MGLYHIPDYLIGSCTRQYWTKCWQQLDDQHHNNTNESVGILIVLTIARIEAFDLIPLGKIYQLC